MREFIELPGLSMPGDLLERIQEDMVPWVYRRNMHYCETPSLNDELMEWFSDTFHSDQLTSQPRFGVLKTLAGVDGHPHVDKYTFRYPDGTKYYRLRQTVINIPISGDWDVSYVAYLDDDRNELESYYFGHPYMLNASLLHQVFNAKASQDRTVFSIGIYDDDLATIKSLMDRGLFLK